MASTSVSHKNVRPSRQKAPRMSGGTGDAQALVDQRTRNISKICSGYGLWCRSISCMQPSASRGSAHATQESSEASMEFEAIVRRVRGEFLEMPGLTLTVAQAGRLWGLEQDLCQRVIGVLIG